MNSCPGIQTTWGKNGQEMGSVDGNGGSELVVTELSHIKELVRQLEVHLGGSPELCKHLASQIFSLTERSIGMITLASLDGGRKRSIADLPFKTTKKRKMMEKWKHQVRVSSAGSGESPVVDDGHSWRKYGQKEILGAKHPRGYYRCTHRHSQGCEATKQVQRTDEDPTLFDVIYHGTHTCVDKAVAAAKQPPEQNWDAHSLLQSLSADLTAKAEELAVAAEPRGWSATTPFCFSSTPASGCLERSPFSAPSTLGNCGVSPASSGSNHAATFPPFEDPGDAKWREQSELVSALVTAGAPPAPAVDSLDEFLDIDISSFFA